MNHIFKKILNWSRENILYTLVLFFVFLIILIKLNLTFLDSNIKLLPWELKSYVYNFQFPATFNAKYIIKVHNYIFAFLIGILVFVLIILYDILLKFFNFEKVSKTDIHWISRLKSNHNTTLEIIWTCIPSLILILIAIPSFGLLYAMDSIVDPQITVKIIGHQWYWSYEYSDYSEDWYDITFDSYMLSESDLKCNDIRLLSVDNPLILPWKTYIRLNVSSADVLHSWAVPSLGVKLDAVPHRINSTIIFIKKLGIFYGQCSEICGVNHGFMPIKLIVEPLEDYLYFIIRYDWLVANKAVFSA